MGICELEVGRFSDSWNFANVCAIDELYGQFFACVMQFPPKLNHHDWFVWPLRMLIIKSFQSSHLAMASCATQSNEHCFMQTVGSVQLFPPPILLVCTIVDSSRLTELISITQPRLNSDTPKYDEWKKGYVIMVKSNKLDLGNRSQFWLWLNRSLQIWCFGRKSNVM